MGVDRIPVGSAVDAMTLLKVNRGVASITYTSATQLTQPTTTGGSMVDDGTTNGTLVAPKMSMSAGRITPGPNEVAEALEHFNQDPFISAYEPNIRGDVYFGLPIYVSAYFMPNFSPNLAAGCYFGLSIGALTGSGLAGLGAAGSQISFHLRYDIFSDAWHVVVVNKWAAVNHKVFDINLGTSAAIGVLKPLQGQGSHFEILYMPNDYCDFYVDQKLIVHFTDAAYGGMLGGVDTPMADIYRNRATIGSTIKGISVYAITGPAGASQNHECYVYNLKTSVMGLL